MNHSLLGLVVVVLLSPFSLLNAQTPCGNIIAPETYYDATSNLVSTPITNCTNPFNETSADHAKYGLSIDGQIIVHNGTIEVSEGGTSNYQFVGSSGNGFLIPFFRVFRHSDADYQFVNTDEPEITEADYRVLAQEHFGAGVDIEEYVQAAIIRDDDNYTDEFKITLYDYLDYVDAHFVPVLPKLRAGTYTLETREDLLILSNRGFFRNLLEKIIPTVYAQEYVPEVFTFTFTITEHPPEPEGASSVLFLPGIQASLLSTKDGSGNVDQIWDPLGNQDVRKLAMDVNGHSINSVHTSGIMATIPFSGTVYDSFARFMVQLVADDIIAGWTPFAYDWRYSVDDIAENGAVYEEGVRDPIDEIERLAVTSSSRKVTIIGHSNGGLLAKAIMRRLEREGKANLVDKVILLASPQLGTPKAVGTILHGYDQEKLGGWAIDDAVARDVIQNMPGAYGLVPTQEYFDATSQAAITFDSSASTNVFRSVYGTTIDSEAELQQFMIGTEGRANAVTVDDALKGNSVQLNSALNTHRTILDNWVAPDGVQVVEVVGLGLDTVSGFEYRGFSEKTCTFGLFCSTKEVYKPVPIISQYGDKTVIGVSAEGYRGVKEKYYFNLKASENNNESIEHYNFTETLSVQKLVKNILTGTTSANIQFISTTTPSAFGTNRIMFSSHSPVQLEVMDSNGKKVSFDRLQGASVPVEEIDNSTYLEVGDSKYVIVPDGEQYEITLKGTGKGGLTFSLDTLQGETQVKTLEVKVATVTASTTIRVPYTTNTIGNLSIDTNSDGQTDILLSPAGVDITPKITYAQLKSSIQSLTLSLIRKAPLLLLVATADTLDKKSVTNPKLVPLELLALNQLEALIASYQKKGWITQVESAKIIAIINKLK